MPQTASPRGLAAASKATKRRVTQLGGYAVAIKLGDLFTEARAERAGMACVERHGREFYSRLAHKRWQKIKSQERQVKRLIARDEKSGGWKCKRCGKHRNTVRSMQRHVKKHL